jgi:uncharacterized protein
MTEAEIQLLIAALPGIEALVKSVWSAHNSGVTTLADAKAAIAGGIAALAGMPATDAAEDAKLHEAFESNTPVPTGAEK